MNKNNWYVISNIEEIDSPALVVYPARVEENIRLLISMIDDVQHLRPHIKTHKTREATLLMMSAGIQKFKCATIAEAEMLAMCKAPDVLLAYQPVGPKLQRLIKLIKKYPETTFSCLADNIFSAQQIADAAEANKIILSVYIDLNAGMNRTGILPGKEAIALYETCIKSNGITPVGLHAYDGHIHDADIQTRKEKCNDAFAPVEAMRKALLEKGYADPIIVAGGTPTFPIHAKRKNVVCSPGTFIYWDAGYQRSFTEQPFLPAALVITRVISLPAPDLLCLDLGHKSISSESSLDKRMIFLNAPELKAVSHNEEHLVVQTNEKHGYKVGDVFYALPFHICPTTALYEKAVIIEEGKATGEWKIIGRDRRIEV